MASKRTRKAKTEQHDAHVLEMIGAFSDVSVGDLMAPAEEMTGETDFAAEAPIEMVEDAVAELEANEDMAIEAPVEEIATESQDFATILQEVDVAAVEAKVLATQNAFDERVAFERIKNASNENIHKTLKKSRDGLVRAALARVLVATAVDPQVINRSTHEGSAYNVYAIDKLRDLTAALAGAPMQNAINRACMKSLFAFRAAGLAFTGEMAKAAASDKIRVADAVKKALVRHTVSASTAPTQASSTMQALTTLGLVRREGSSKNPTFTLVEGPALARLEKALAA